MIAANKPAAQSQKASKAKTSAKVTRPKAWPTESLSGKIMMVNAALNLAVVKGPDGIPFDPIATHSTRIASGNQAVKLSDLSSDTNKSVSVKFVPERKGDVARSIQLNG